MISESSRASSAPDRGGVSSPDRMAETLLEQPPNVAPPLHREFRPAWLGNRAFRAEVARSKGVRLALALERDAGSVSVFETSLLPPGHPQATSNLRYVERILKFLLWQKGGFRVGVAGLPEIAEHLAREYAPGGARAFDADFLARIYERPAFIVESLPFEALPEEREQGIAI